MGKLHRKVTSSRGSRVLSSTLTLLAILVFVVYTSSDFSELYSSLTGGDGGDDTQKVQAMISDIKLEIQSGGSISSSGSIGSGSIGSGSIGSIGSSGSIGSGSIGSGGIGSVGSVGSIDSSTRRATPAPAGAIAAAAAATTASSSSLVGTQMVHGPNNFKHCNLDFDPQHNLQEILGTSPVVMFVNSGLESQELRTLLTKEYEISPAPSVVDLDKHACGTQLDGYIRKHALKSVSPQVLEPPYLLINGGSVINRGLKGDVIDLHTEGLLLDKLKTFAGTEVLVSRTNAPSNS